MNRGVDDTGLANQPGHPTLTSLCTLKGDLRFEMSGPRLGIDILIHESVGTSGLGGDLDRIQAQLFHLVGIRVAAHSKIMIAGL